MEIDYVTSNKKKFEEALHILDASDRFSFVHTPLHLDELQESPEAIALHKAREAYKKLHKPVIIDDLSLHCYALNGLPGPYIKHFLDTIGDDGLYTLISHYTDHRVDALCTIAFYDGRQEPLLFQGKLSGTIVAPSGNLTLHAHRSWNRIVQPDGHSKTVASMPLSELSKISARGHALRKLRDYLNEHYLAQGVSV